jgi:hypothetical protein
MKYILLIYDNEKKFKTASKVELDGMMAEYRAFGDSITKSGNWKAGHQLQPTEAATSLRFRDGKLNTIDGPFAETKEQLGGFYLVECRDIDEAIDVAARIPGATHGSIEIRPIWDVPYGASVEAVAVAG